MVERTATAPKRTKTNRFGNLKTLCAEHGLEPLKAGGGSVRICDLNTGTRVGSANSSAEGLAWVSGYTTGKGAK